MGIYDRMTTLMIIMFLATTGFENVASWLPLFRYLDLYGPNSKDLVFVVFIEILVIGKKLFI